MPTGIQIINTWGTILISHTNPNYTFKAGGSGVTNGSRMFSVSVTGVEVMVAFRSTAKSFHRTTVISGGVFTFTFESEFVGDTIEYWLFDVHGTPVAGNLGLQVFGANGGALMYDSNQEIALVVGDTAFTTTGQSATLPAGKSYAVVAVASGRRRQGRTTLVGGSYEWEFRFFTPYLSYSGTTFSFTLEDSGWVYSSTEEVDMPQLFKNAPPIQARCIFLDVTGL